MTVPIGKFTAVIIIIFLMDSCVYYSPMRISRPHFISDFVVKKPGKDVKGASAYSMPDIDRKGYLPPARKKEEPVYQKRFFAQTRSSSPVAKMNNRGVDFASIGRFRQAKILFEESIREDGNFAPAYNNLGIIFELFQHRDEAFRMYSRACVIDPDNEYYRRNFLFSLEIK